MYTFTYNRPPTPVIPRESTLIFDRCGTPLGYLEFWLTDPKPQCAFCENTPLATACHDCGIQLCSDCARLSYLNLLYCPKCMVCITCTSEACDFCLICGNPVCPACVKTVDIYDETTGYREQREGCRECVRGLW